MVLFGNITVTRRNLQIEHPNVTAYDHVLNYGCGFVFVILVLLGVTLSVFVYYYHWKKKVSWIARYYRFLAFISIISTGFKSLPLSIYLLMPCYIDDVKHISYLNQFLWLLSLISWVSQLTVVFMLNLMQWIYIHRACWSLVYATRFKKIVMINLLILCVLCILAFGAILIDSDEQFIGWLEEIQTAYANTNIGGVVYLILVIIPQLLLVTLSVAFFLATCIMLYRSSINVTEKMKCQLTTIGLMVCGVSFWAVMKVMDAAISWTKFREPYNEIVAWFLQNNFIPAVLAVYNTVVIAACDGKIRAALLVFLKTGKLEVCDYEQLNEF